MNFTKDEARAMVWSMVSVVMADRQVAPQEEALLMKIITERLHQTITLLVEARTLTQQHVIPVLKAMTRDKKDFLVEQWDELMMVDGHIDVNEVKIIVAMGKAIDANVSAYNYLLGVPISSIENLSGTTWESTDNSIKIAFDANSINGCTYNGNFGIYSYDRNNDLIRISLNDNGLCQHYNIVITSQYDNVMGVVINGKSYQLIRK